MTNQADNAQGPGAIPDALKRATIERCHKNAMALGYHHPHLLLIHARIRDRYVVTREIKTFAISADGYLSVNPEFCASIKSPEELQGVIAHEILHPTLGYFERGQAMGLITPEMTCVPGRERDLELWNIAHDMAINGALRTDKIKLPASAVYAPPEYKGELIGEHIYDWLRKQQKQQPQSGGSGSGSSGGQQDSNAQGAGQGQSAQGDATAGCGMLPPHNPGQGQNGQQGAGQGQQAPGQGQPGQGQAQGAGESSTRIDWAQVGREARAMAVQIGRGSSAISRLLDPPAPRIRWEKVIRRGFGIANQARGRDRATYSKVSRRNRPGVILPGWTQTNPKIAIVIDVSSSMGEEAINAIVAETLSCMRTFPGARTFLVTHTDRVCWQGWVRPGGDKVALHDATQFGGGTDARPAYEAVAALGEHFDTLIHFTDCELSGTWPDVPARKLIVGATGTGAHDPYCKPPEGAEVIPCADI